MISIEDFLIQPNERCCENFARDAEHHCGPRFCGECAFRAIARPATRDYIRLAVVPLVVHAVDAIHWARSGTASVARLLEQRQSILIFDLPSDPAIAGVAFGVPEMLTKAADAFSSPWCKSGYLKEKMV
jgi:hypothetical protein